MSNNADTYILRCIELAQLSKGHTAPNPMVGAVLVHEGRIIGEGWHRLYGQAHAEVNCLESVAEKDRQLVKESTMYVNLEPCAHHGRTPPCSVRLVQEQVKEVVIANVDPYEQVGGRGIEILKAANIDVTTGVLKARGLWLNRRFFCFHQQRRPYIILKWAQTVEGYIAPPDGSRFQITNTSSQQLVHKWRTEEAAIMVGYNTALNDDPQLTARLWTGKHPLRIVLDRKLQLPQTYRLFDDAADTWILNEQRDEAANNLYYIKIPFDDTLLQQLLSKLHAANVLSVIVEGGAQLLQSFIAEGLWDEARVFTGATSLPDGIAAPILHDANHVMHANIGGDDLNLFVNQNSAYPYVQGMML